ncbi:MAG TPA: phosphoglycerate mutase family protein [Gemmatimonadaceae bacterium]|jgi:broad specificity phosphatase PhoE|nr:phosphoglycerate mutase family protein [Gemmatimonadaceae bacterium]
MRLSRLFLAILVFPAALAAQTTVILTRHAEKAAAPADDPPLTAEGEARARALFTAVKDAGISAIITTNFARTKATAAPTASALGITPEALVARDPNHVQAVVDAVRRHTGRTVLVVGHSNTVPAIIAALGAPRPPDICDATYDDLFVVTLHPDGKATFVHSRYGAPSPAATCASMK